MTERRANDAYQTPRSCIEKLLPYVDFRSNPTFLEPCRGEGNIYNLVPCKHKLYCEITEGKDYFDKEFPGVDIIITNPPFSMWRPFLEKSLSEAETVIYLLRLNCLGSGSKTKRGKFWNSNKPTHLFPLESRPSFTGDGTDSTDYGWFCFDRGNRIRTKEWLTVL